MIKINLPLMFFSTLLVAHQPALALSDMQMQEKVLKTRESTSQPHMDHSAHDKAPDQSQTFHGVFYGFLPCDDCDGLKMTLSLKQNNNYLLVSQYAKESSREFYEKGKYTWDEKTRTVVLTPRKDAAIRQFRIEDEGTLVQLDSKGAPMSGNQESYTLRRSDTVKSRQVHIH
ncbi:MAG: copper resistance protein NlpE N-terminal domain-containing protein [Methylomonas sp.]|nr:copper resistance protein NlpE N-terminal domain-containing protein [Methylomonas sp.]